MTCIAYRRGILAADRLVSDSYSQSRVGVRSKIFQAADQLVYGFSGSAGHAELFREWLSSGAKSSERPNFGERGHQAIMIGRLGVGLSSGDVPVFVDIEAKYYAIGSGAEIAMGAMWHGATAEEAVQAAIEHDTSCGGPIDLIRCYEQPNQFRAETSVTAPYADLHESHFGGAR